MRALVLVCLLGCAGGELETGDGGAAAVDGPLPVADAPLGFDARRLDARIADAAIACTSGGRVGVCFDTDLQTCAGQRVTGLCPGPANVICCLPLDAGTTGCDPSAMPAPNAGLGEAPGQGGCPAGMLRVGGTFCIDRYEAFLELSDGQGGFEPWSPYFNPGAREAIARSAAGAVPQGYIDGVQAGQACARAGKRLCTDGEWLRACQGPDGLTYPYGDDRLPGACNDARAVHPAVELFGSVTNLSSPCINQLHDSLAAAGAHPDCRSAEGALDMMGNLHEWTADPAGTFRGGFYVDTVINGDGCMYRTTAHDTAYSDYSTGFRCCAD